MAWALLVLCALAAAQNSLSPETEFAEAQQRLFIDGDIRVALRRYQVIIANPAASRTTRAKALFEVGRCQEKLGDKSASDAYRRILNEFPDQGAIAAQARQRLSRLEPPVRPAVQRVAERSDIGLFGAIAPDGSRLGYVSFDDQLCVFETAGGQVRCLTPRNSGGIRSMAFSADGSRIAYGLGADPEARSLHVALLRDGTSRRMLRPDDQRFLAPADWSGDAVLIGLEERTRKAASLATISLSSGEVRTLRSFPGRHPLPARYSPDGRFIAFNLGPDIHVMTANGAEAWPAVVVAGSDLLVGWANDFLVFLSDRRGVQDLWALPVRNGRPAGAPIVLHRNLNEARSLGMSRDASFHYVSSTPTSEVFLAELDGVTGELKGPPVPADPAGASISGFADWSPDGAKIAYWSTPAGRKLTLKVRTLQTGEEHEVPVDVFQPGLIRWFPDGASVLTEAFDPEHGDRFYKISLSDGASHVAIPHDLSRDSSVNPAWLDAGNTLLFRARLGGYRTPGRGKLYTWNFAESRLGEIPSPEQFGSWALSPSGKQLAFLIHEDAADVDVLRIGEVGQRETRLVYRTQPGQTLKKSGAVAWTRDETAVIAAMGTTSNPRVHELWRFPAQGGRPRRILSSGVLKDLRMHPDGRRFSFTAGGVRQDVWALKNALPRASFR